MRIYWHFFKICVSAIGRVRILFCLFWVEIESFLPKKICEPSINAQWQLHAARIKSAFKLQSVGHDICDTIKLTPSSIDATFCECIWFPENIFLTTVIGKNARKSKSKSLSVLEMNYELKISLEIHKQNEHEQRRRLLILFSSNFTH